MENSTVSVQTVAVERVRHFAANFPALEKRFEGKYPRIFVSGHGVYLVDSDGRRVIDGGNHLGACSVGHTHPEVIAAISEQLQTLEFTSLEAGASHVYVAQLAERLASLVPLEGPIFSFTSTGSEANELAIKIARDYFRRLGQPGRNKILTRQSSYHGSSYATTTATRIPAFRDSFQPLVPGFVELPQPFPGYCGSCDFGVVCPGACIQQTADVIEREGPETIAAILAEPISIPGAIKVPPSDYWPRLRELCDRHGILLIADEVVSGFGRTGKLFGCDHWGIRPDMMSMAKALTSGYIPMGALAVNRRIQEVFANDPLTHVNTYAGHPVACAAAMKTLDILERDGLVEKAAGHEPSLILGLEAAVSGVDWTTRVSVRGLIGSVEIQVPATIDAEAVRMDLWNECYEQGVVLRVTRGAQTVSLLFYPPLSISESELAVALSGIERAMQSTYHLHQRNVEESIK